MSVLTSLSSMFGTIRFQFPGRMTEAAEVVLYDGRLSPADVLEAVER